MQAQRARRRAAWSQHEIRLLKVRGQNLSVRRPKKRKRRASPVSMASLRVADLNRLLRDRYCGETLPNDDAGADDARIVASHVARLPGRNPVSRIIAWLNLRAPWMPIADRIELADCVLADPRIWTADALAVALNVTATERTRLRLWTIGAIDESREQRLAKRKERDRARKEAKRRAAGAKPRAQFESQGSPWIALEISRRTWERRRRRAA